MKSITTHAELAMLLNLSQAMLRRLAHEGTVVRVKGDTFDTAKSVTGYCTKLQQQIADATDRMG